MGVAEPLAPRKPAHERLRPRFHPCLGGRGFGHHPLRHYVVYTWYLAEGSTYGGMLTCIVVQNPGGESAHIKLTFQTGSGEVLGPEADLPAGSRTTFLANNYVPGNPNVSTKVESDKPVVCERPVYGAGFSWATASIGYSQ